MSGQKSKKKGYRGEYTWRKLCEKKGLETVWHNDDPRLPDMTVKGITCEVKFGYHVPSSLYDWLEEKKADILALRRNHKNWLVVMRAEMFFELDRRALFWTAKRKRS